MDNIYPSFNRGEIQKASSQCFALILLRIYQNFTFSSSPESFMNAILWWYSLYIPFSPDGILNSGLRVKISVQVPLHLLILQMNRSSVGRSPCPLKSPLQSRGCLGGMGDLNIACLNGHSVMHIPPNHMCSLFLNYYTRSGSLAGKYVPREPSQFRYTISILFSLQFQNFPQSHASVICELWGRQEGISEASFLCSHLLPYILPILTSTPCPSSIWFRYVEPSQLQDLLFSS